MIEKFVVILKKVCTEFFESLSLNKCKIEYKFLGLRDTSKKTKMKDNKKFCLF